MALPFLPDEILLENILTRLPVKSVVRFQSVCKSWNSLFSEPSFAQSRINSSISENPNDDYLIFYTSKFNHGTNIPINGLSILSRTSLSETRLNNVPYPTSSQYHMCLVGSINGLVCMAFFSKVDHYFIIWNPATSLFNKILPPKPSLLKFEHHSDLLCGFCWDSLANDFKLVDVCLESSQAVVFSCKMGCWSDEVVSIDFYMPGPKYRYPSPTIIRQGMPYWELSNGTILKFDPRYNYFSYLVVDVGLSYSLMNWNDSLTLIEYNLDGSMAVYRYFEGYGQCLLWYTIDYDVWKNKFAPYPMCFKYSGEVVFNGMSNLYDPTSNKIRNIGYHYEHVHGFSYAPSLVSLEGMKPLQPKITKDGIRLTRQFGRIKPSRSVDSGCCPMIRKVTRGGRHGKIYPKGWKCISHSGRTSIVGRVRPIGTRPAIICRRRTGRLRGQTATATKAD